MILGYHWVLWVSFITIFIISMYYDMRTHKDDHIISPKEAVISSACWVGLAILFGLMIAFDANTEAAKLFFAGYILEKSLSVDNLFVFMAIFSSFHIASKYQHRVLYYGIFGAIILRIFFILFVNTIANLGPYALTAIGLFVFGIAVKMVYELYKDEKDTDPDYHNHFVVKWVQKMYPVYPNLDGHNFFTMQNGVKMVTPLFLCLCIVEVSDIAFAFDSVPAVIAITQDFFLVLTSNIFAILGLRSLYFLLEAAKNTLCHLEKAIIVILAFIGIKLIFAALNIFHIDSTSSLAIVLTLLSIGVASSLAFPQKEYTTNA